MKQRDDGVYLHDIVDAIQQVEAYLDGVDFQAFRTDRMRQDAVVRQIGIIGEASRKLSDQLREERPDIPWADIIGMRHKVLHDYFDVDEQTMWDTVRSDLPKLKQQVLRILQDRTDGT